MLSKMKNFFKKSITKSVFVTILLLLILTINTFFTIHILKNHLEETGINSILETTNHLIMTIQQTDTTSYTHLQALSNLLASQEKMDSVEVKKMLSSLHNENMIHDFFILLPNNQLLSQDGSYIPNQLELRFEDEKKKSYYTSKRLSEFATIKEPLIYQAIPINQNNKTVGILYGITKLNTLSELFQINSFKGQANVYLIEKDTGNLILNSLQNSATNLNQLERGIPKTDTDLQHIQKEIRQGKSDLQLFSSNQKRKYFYFCYKPVGINDWSIALSVPQSAIFEHIDSIKANLYAFTLIKFVAIFGYLAWILYFNNKEANRKNLELNQVQYVSDIQKTLFDVHQTSEHMTDALNQIKEKLQAEVSFFFIRKEKGQPAYSWVTSNISIEYMIEDFSEIEMQLKQTGHYFTYHINELKTSMPKAYEKFVEYQIHSIMLVLVKDPNEHIVGILGAFNMNDKWKDACYLECVALSFFLAYQNIKNQKTIGEMATVDMLTGLLNRNSHEMALKRFKEGESSPNACIYIDVNGLHELNNSLGHTAGDEMLRFIGHSLQESFGSECTFRIGGDEFLALLSEDSKEEIEKKLHAFAQKVEEKNYHVSVGFEYTQKNSDIEAMIANAEQKMYQDKKEYYRKNPHIRKTRI